MERLMHYVWQYRLVNPADMVTVDGRKVTVIDPGRHNTDSGPDFFNAKVRIGDRLWAGDVEIHVRASDWHRHGHHNDVAYDSVVLHVVDCDDVAVERRNGERIPQLVMRCAPDFHKRYDGLVGRSDIDLPCAPEMGEISPLHMRDWITALAYERAYAKAERITEHLERCAGDWEQTLYVTLARGLGFGTNAEPMERLALSLPLHFLRKHSDSATAIEALMFGQAGLLPERSDGDRYADSLKREYAFLAHKFSLRPVESPGWKMARMRPANFPHRRVATLAAFVTGDFRLVSRMVGLRSVEDAIALLRTPLTGYWATRFTFSPVGSERVYETMSRASAMVLVINVAVPLMIAYGMRHGDQELVQRGFDWLTEMPAESNSIVGAFASAGIEVKDAFTSQALIQLRREYCEKHGCLFCRIGHRLLSKRARR